MNRLTQNEFEKKATKIHGKKYKFGQYTGHRDSIDISCPDHGPFSRYTGDVLGKSSRKTKILCSDCRDEQKAIKNLKDFKVQARRIHGDRYDYSSCEPFLSKKQKVLIYCIKHEYTFPQRVGAHLKGQGCDICGKKKAHEKESLYYLYPNLMSEWDWGKNEKNNVSNPRELRPFSGVEAWWICPKLHSYKLRVANRSLGAGCNICPRPYSSQEFRIKAELHFFFEHIQSGHRYKGREVDIFIPKINAGIEYDGHHWHKSRIEEDLAKHRLLSQHIDLIRVRQAPLKRLKPLDLIVKNKDLKKDDLNKLVIMLGKFNDLPKIDEYLASENFINEALYNHYLSFFPSPITENSLLTIHPWITEEWDYDKNYPLRPENFTPQSNKRMDFICENGHQISLKIQDRVESGENKMCPDCYLEENSVRSKFPKVAEEWHPDKNPDMTPEGTLSFSDKTVWWVCPRGHDYERRIRERTQSGLGCTENICEINNKVNSSTGNSLSEYFPELAKEWHPKKNGIKTPENTSYGERFLAWWICPKKHVYSKPVRNRTINKRGCTHEVCKRENYQNAWKRRLALRKNNI